MTDIIRTREEAFGRSELITLEQRRSALASLASGHLTYRIRSRWETMRLADHPLARSSRTGNRTVISGDPGSGRVQMTTDQPSSMWIKNEKRKRTVTQMDSLRDAGTMLADALSILFVDDMQ